MTRRILIDLESGRLSEERGDDRSSHDLATPEAFAALSEVWLRSGWQNNHVYTFTWLGRPIIQLPEDMVRTQEVLYHLRPDVILETGIAHGGSLVFYASLCRLMGRGRVIGVDIEIRPHNRKAIEEHELVDLITMIEGDSTAPETIGRVRSLIGPEEQVFVMLDGNHTKSHVLAELEAYAPLVSPGSYIVAADGLMQKLAGLRRHHDQRPTDDWDWNNPAAAATEFVSRHDDFRIEPPAFAFNESPLAEPITYWKNGWIRRIR